jgi:hypothetical protein
MASSFSSPYRKVREEMNTNQRRITLSLGAVTGGLLAAAFLPMAVAVADEYDLTPDTSTFDPTSPVQGFPPYYSEVTGTESWSFTDLTTNSVQVSDVFGGTDKETTIGSFTNNDFSGTSGEIESPGFAVSGGGLDVDLANFGGGYENEFVDVPSGADGAGLSDLLITPMGDFSLFGSFFTDVSTLLF